MVGKKEKYLVAAQKFIERGQLDKALAEFAKVVQDDPKDTRTWLRMAELHARRSAVPEAVDIYLRTAELYVEQGFAQKAIAVYKNVLKLAPGTITAHLKLGGLFNQMGLISDGVQQMELAAAAQQRAGNLPESTASLRRALEMQPDNVVLRVKLAEMASQAGIQDEAIREFGSAADQLKAQGRSDEHLRVLERLLFHDVNNLTRAYELAEAYIARGNPRLALPKLQACINAAPRDPRGLTLLAKGLEQLAQIPKAVSVLKELAALCDELGRVSERDAAIVRALSLDASDPEVQSAAERYHVRRSDVRGYEPTPPPLGVGIGPSDVGSGSPFPGPVSRADSFDGGASGVSQVGLDAGVDAGAGIAFDLGAGAGPGPGAGTSPSEFSGRVLSSPGTVETARLSSSGGAQSGDPDIGRILAESEVYVKYGILDRAAEHLRRALVADPGHRGAREKLVDTLVDLGRKVEAARELEQLGLDLARTDAGQARRVWERALALDPGSERAREGLSSLNAPLQSAALEAVGPDARGADPHGHARDRVAEAIALGDDSAGFPVPGTTADVPIAWDVPVSGSLSSSVSGPVSIPISLSTGPHPSEVAAGGAAEGGAIVDDIAEDVSDELSVDASGSGGIIVATESAPAVIEDSSAHHVSESDVVHSSADASEDPALDVVTPPPETQRQARATAEIEIASIVSEAPADSSLPGTPTPAPAPAADLPVADASTAEPSGWGVQDAGVTAERPLPAALLELEARETPPPAGIAGPWTPPPDLSSSVHAPELMPSIDTDRERHEPADAYLDHDPDSSRVDAGAGSIDDASGADFGDDSGDDFGSESGSSARTRAAPDWYGGAAASPTPAPAPEPKRAPAPEPIPAAMAAWPTDDAELAAEIDQADFFLEQQMPEEALSLLDELMERWPGHPTIEAKRLEVEGALARAHAAGPGGPAVPPPSVAPATHIEPIGVPREVTPAPVAIVADGAQADYTTHADLGIAYKEMGLFDAAINEFKVVTQDPVREVFALTMMGECYEAKGQLTEAVIRYKRALNCEQVTEAENIALYFLLGAAFERLGDVGEALYFYEKVVKRDPTFRGVGQKVATLKPRLARRA